MSSSTDTFLTVILLIGLTDNPATDPEELLLDPWKKWSHNKEITKLSPNNDPNIKRIQAY